MTICCKSVKGLFGICIAILQQRERGRGSGGAVQLLDRGEQRHRQRGGRQGAVNQKIIAFMVHKHKLLIFDRLQSFKKITK